jgi:aminopeptidase N
MRRKGWRPVATASLVTMPLVTVSLASAACGKPAPTHPIDLSSPPGITVPSPLVTSSAQPGFHPGAATMGDPLAPGEGNGGYDVGHYALSIGYTPTTQQLTGTDVITARATQGLSRFDFDLHGLTVDSVAVDQATAAFARTADKLVITPARGIPLGATFTVDIRYHGVPTPYRDPQLGVEGFLPRPDGALAQGEPQVAASWYPVNDHPRDKATYDISITAPSALAALSNGVLVGKTTAAGRTTWHWRESQPMASYLATAAIGDYRVVTSTHDGRPVVLAVASSLPASYDAVLARTPEVLDFLVTQFGPYPFDASGGIIHDDSQVRFALENQTRPVYAPVFFQRAGDATWVIAHELAHQWYGDSLSVTNWRDLWLNEGFATYAEWLWTEHTGGQSAQESFADMYQGILARKISPVPPANPTAATLFSDSVYKRGAATLGALRITIGDQLFFKVLRGWAADHAGTNVSTEEFIAYVDRVTGRHLDNFFQAWLYSGGTPPYPKPLGG